MTETNDDDVARRLDASLHLPIPDALNALGMAIDHAADIGEPLLARRALEFADALDVRDPTAVERTVLDYFRANAWACIATDAHAAVGAIWSWEQPEVLEQTLHLRRAVRSDGFASLDVVRRCQILTNLGNQLETIGRFVEAQECWTRALEIEPTFWMARANRGRGLTHYAGALYDPGHEDVLVLYAHEDLDRSARDAASFPGLGSPSVAPMIDGLASSIRTRLDLDAVRQSYDADNPTLEEMGLPRYRRWCLDHRLFLNPLNDVMARPIAARDILHLPSFSSVHGDASIIVGAYDQLKQEYVSARWLHYAGSELSEPHPSDDEVWLPGASLDRHYGLALEQTKQAFRMAYSLFDKIALLVERYLNLGIPPHRISFRSIWVEGGGKPVRAIFESFENWPLRGLAWLGKDLFEPGLRSVMEPDAEDLSDLRNHLEHRYVRVCASLPFGDADRKGGSTYAITRSELDVRTLRILKLARSALIYLSLGLHRYEERTRDGSVVDGSIP